MYLHGELKYPGHRCDHRFAFSSELKVRKYSHRRLKMHMCSRPNCQKVIIVRANLPNMRKSMKIKFGAARSGLIISSPSLQFY